MNSRQGAINMASRRALDYERTLEPVELAHCKELIKSFNKVLDKNPHEEVIVVHRFESLFLPKKSRAWDCLRDNAIKEHFQLVRDIECLEYRQMEFR
jgi:hypothetical protein